MACPLGAARRDLVCVDAPKPDALFLHLDGVAINGEREAGDCVSGKGWKRRQHQIAAAPSKGEQMPGERVLLQHVLGQH
jgi:hypothetical protein